ncbi:MAG: chloride channel protein [Vulcanimicrobiaceae bacterium]
MVQLAIGGAIAAFIAARFAPEAKGHGVPEVMEAVALRGGKMRPRVIAIKALASATTIGFGGSCGRERIIDRGRARRDPARESRPNQRRLNPDASSLQD